MFSSLLILGISFLATSQNQADSTRIAELDQFWDNLSRTVKEGDFEGYAITYHEDAVVVFATGEKKASKPVSEALEGWKQGFVDTKKGIQQDEVEFYFSQRLGSETTAHETGMFLFTSKEANSDDVKKYIVHFEALLVKKDGKWLMVMEHQKSMGTEEEWSNLKYHYELIEGHGNNKSIIKNE